MSRIQAASALLLLSLPNGFASPLAQEALPVFQLLSSASSASSASAATPTGQVVALVKPSAVSDVPAATGVSNLTGGVVTSPELPLESFASPPLVDPTDIQGPKNVFINPVPNPLMPSITSVLDVDSVLVTPVPSFSDATPSPIEVVSAILSLATTPIALPTGPALLNSTVPAVTNVSVPVVAPVVAPIPANDILADPLALLNTATAPIALPAGSALLNSTVPAVANVSVPVVAPIPLDAILADPLAPLKAATTALTLPPQIVVDLVHKFINLSFGLMNIAKNTPVGGGKNTGVVPPNLQPISRVRRQAIPKFSTTSALPPVSKISSLMDPLMALANNLASKIEQVPIAGGIVSKIPLTEAVGVIGKDDLSNTDPADAIGMIQELLGLANRMIATMQMPKIAAPAGLPFDLLGSLGSLTKRDDLGELDPTLTMGIISQILDILSVMTDETSAGAAAEPVPLDTILSVANGLTKRALDVKPDVAFAIIKKIISTIKKLVSVFPGLDSVAAGLPLTETVGKLPLDTVEEAISGLPLNDLTSKLTSGVSPLAEVASTLPATNVLADPLAVLNPLVAGLTGGLSPTGPVAATLPAAGLAANPAAALLTGNVASGLLANSLLGGLGKRDMSTAQSNTVMNIAQELLNMAVTMSKELPAANAMANQGMLEKRAADAYISPNAIAETLKAILGIVSDLSKKIKSAVPAAVPAVLPAPWVPEVPVGLPGLSLPHFAPIISAPIPILSSLPVTVPSVSVAVPSVSVAVPSVSVAAPSVPVALPSISTALPSAPALPSLPVALPSLPLSVPSVASALPSLPALPSLSLAALSAPVAVPSVPVALPSISTALPRLAALPSLPVAIASLRAAAPSGLPTDFPDFTLELPEDLPAELTDLPAELLTSVPTEVPSPPVALPTPISVEIPVDLSTGLPTGLSTATPVPLPLPLSVELPSGLGAELPAAPPTDLSASTLPNLPTAGTTESPADLSDLPSLEIDPETGLPIEDVPLSKAKRDVDAAEPGALDIDAATKLLTLMLEIAINLSAKVSEKGLNAAANIDGTIGKRDSMNTEQHELFNIAQAKMTELKEALATLESAPLSKRQDPLAALTSATSGLTGVFNTIVELLTTILALLSDNSTDAITGVLDDLTDKIGAQKRDLDGDSLTDLLSTLLTIFDTLLDVTKLPGLGALLQGLPADPATVAADILPPVDPTSVLTGGLPDLGTLLGGGIPLPLPVIPGLPLPSLPANPAPVLPGIPASNVSSHLASTSGIKATLSLVKDVPLDGLLGDLAKRDGRLHARQLGSLGGGLTTVTKPLTTVVAPVVNVPVAGANPGTLLASKPLTTVTGGLTKPVTNLAGAVGNVGSVVAPVVNVPVAGVNPGTLLASALGTALTAPAVVLGAALAPVANLADAIDSGKLLNTVGSTLGSIPLVAAVDDIVDAIPGSKALTSVTGQLGLENPLSVVNNILGGDPLAPVTNLKPITDPILTALAPAVGAVNTVVNGVTAPLADVTDPIAAALAPVGGALEPVVSVLKPVADVTKPVSALVSPLFGNVGASAPTVPIFAGFPAPLGTVAAPLTGLVSTLTNATKPLQNLASQLGALKSMLAQALVSLKGRIPAKPVKRDASVSRHPT
jgi:hypothetical protein